jgi:hypothetical protein
MKIYIFTLLTLIIMVMSSCINPNQKNIAKEDDQSSFKKETFGYDLYFLQQHDNNVVVLENGFDKAKLIVSPKYQAKVFTSTADGDNGLSFGWVNYKAFSGTPDPHMNAYGGENRLWLGPEGGKFSLFFKPNAPMIFGNWKTPAAFDTDPWTVSNKTKQSVSFRKDMQLSNYAGTHFNVLVERSIKILTNAEIAKLISFTFETSVKAIAYQTDNVITNKGNFEWTEATGMPCLWVLDMFKPTPATVIIVPFKNLGNTPFNDIATTNYFGEIPPDRLQVSNSKLFFKADGKQRGKLGIVPGFAEPVAGSYDSQHKVLTIMIFDLNKSSKYLNQEWNTSKPSFSGDAINTYNDGPLGDGVQMGPFYEIESVSPAAFLKPTQSLSHRHTVFHFTGNEKTLNKIAEKLLGVSLTDIKK